MTRRILIPEAKAAFSSSFPWRESGWGEGAKRIGMARRFGLGSLASAFILECGGLPPL
ncbi:MAG: hypothetical protein ACUVTH_03365 [Thermogutta sp.]